MGYKKDGWLKVHGMDIYAVGGIVKKGIVYGEMVYPYKLVGREWVRRDNITVEALAKGYKRGNIDMK